MWRWCCAPISSHRLDVTTLALRRGNVIIFINETGAGDFGLFADWLVLSWGILLLLAGKPWLFIIALLAYIVAFGKIGCQTH